MVRLHAQRLIGALAAGALALGLAAGARAQVAADIPALQSASQIATTHIPTTATALRTNGYASAGDGGGALWIHATGCEPPASFTGTITQQTPSASSSISGTTLTSGTANAYVVGGYLSGTGVSFNTLVTGQTDSTHWTVSVSQTVTTTTITESYTQLSATSITGTIAVGEAVHGAGLAGGLIVTGGSGGAWVLSGDYAGPSNGSFVGEGPEAMTAGPLGLAASLDGQCWGLASSNLVMPQMFGAKGDNSTDDSAPINDAIAWLDTTFNGGELFLPPKTYKHAAPIYYRSSIRLEGLRAPGDSQPGNGLSSTLNYTGVDAAIRPYQNATWIWYPQIANLTIIAAAETNEVIDATTWNRWKIRDFGLFGNPSGVATAGVRLGAGALVAGNNASYGALEDGYIGEVTYGVNVAGIATSDRFEGVRIQPLASGSCFFIASVVNDLWPNNLTFIHDQCETSLTSVTGINLLTGQGLTLVGNRFELPGSGSKGINVVGSGRDTGGAISAANGVLTAGTVTGVLAQGQQIGGAGLTVNCFVGTNISGAGSGSTWNVVGCAAVSAEALTYTGPTNCTLLGNYYSGLVTLLSDPSTQCSGSDPAISPANPLATLTYGTSVQPDVALGSVNEVTATNGTSFAILAPLHPVLGRMLTITIRNNSGTTLGTITWNGVYKMPSFTAPTNGNQSSVRFYFTPAGNWVQVDTPVITPLA